ncbi:GNAT family N-acetyltransferase [Phycicoccus flavus]|uniref:GNAT family N-acetyltransferase n=1 Tax=Phycicoccus flavus TaxID=2502783 RepID=A0A8T6R9I6_9MICO|nr:GNAT family N-acetyltransferase [Phycicoccus flavus]NHA70060.1 GNAT family N-acetyltransferase [Phycicoccus flavus]
MADPTADPPADPPADAVPGLAPALRVERVTEATWRDYRAVRQASLLDSPRAFWTTYAQSAARSDEEWLALVRSGPAVWLAWDGDRPVGSVGLFHPDGLTEDETYLVGMWVVPSARGSGAAHALVDAALAHAAGEGRRRVLLDVARENVRACRFYLRRGFALTGETGVMPWDPGVEEVRMALDLP